MLPLALSLDVSNLLFTWVGVQIDRITPVHISSSIRWQVSAYCMNECMRMDRSMDEWMMDEWLVSVWINEWMNTWINEYMVGWMNEWMGGWMSYWMTGSQASLFLPCLAFPLLSFLSRTPGIRKKRLRSWWRVHSTDKKQKPVALKGTLYLASITDNVDLTSRMLSGCRHAP